MNQLRILANVVLSFIIAVPALHAAEQKELQSKQTVPETHAPASAAAAAPIRLPRFISLIPAAMPHATTASNIIDEAGTGNLPAVLKLLDEGVDVNKTSRNSGLTALGMAVEMGRNNVVKALLAREDIDPNIRDFTDSSALDLAILRQRPQLVELLVQNRRTDVYTRHPSWKETPLEVAQSKLAEYSADEFNERRETARKIVQTLEDALKNREQ
jgi:ankyrin repeat protein